MTESHVDVQDRESLIYGELVLCRDSAEIVESVKED